MVSGAEPIMRGGRGAAGLLNSASRTTLAALSLGVALGVVLAREARAGAGTVSPVQTSTYSLGTHNPTTFGAGTNIDAVSPSNAGVYGGSTTPWNITNYGRIQGPSGGLDLTSSGSTVTNWGAIGGNGGRWGASPERRRGHQRERRLDQRLCRRHDRQAASAR